MYVYKYLHFNSLFSVDSIFGDSTSIYYACVCVYVRVCVCPIFSDIPVPFIAPHSLPPLALPPLPTPPSSSSLAAAAAATAAVKILRSQVFRDFT